MFTGIITHLGKFQRKEGSRFTFSASRSLLQQLTTGASIAVNGICLTVLKKPVRETFSVEIMPETEKKTNLGTLQQRDIVNVELPATASTLLSGHIVQGHVDGVGKILSVKEEGNSYLFTFSLPAGLDNYLVEKGSIAINGISLTVITVTKKSFTVGIIPHTWKNTMLHTARVHDKVNLEVDVVAKYVEKLLQMRFPPSRE